MELAPLPVGFTLSNFLSISFFGLLLFYAIFTAIFFYHWRTYATNATATNTTLLVYFVVTIPLLFIMGSVVLAQ
jgi:membrane-associated HD superfamily phosphohydrolase